jgi:uncharacterized coiled-coil protein SlyX
LSEAPQKLRRAFPFRAHSRLEVYAVLRDSDSRLEEGFEISPRFRRTIEERIARLECDAEFDEALIPQLENKDHIRRQRRLVAAERAEALRMRIFLDRAGTRDSSEQGLANWDQA